jgi:diguanylate cyclase (GGDEF)-like protein
VTPNEQLWSSLVAEQRSRGSALMSFSPYVEDQFRQYYGQANESKVRPVLVVAAIAVIVVTGVGLVEGNVTAVTATFGLAVMMPILMATLIGSYQKERNLIYQWLLALSALCIGMIMTSLTLRASMHGMMYYFAAEIAWIFVTWLILGLLFWYAAAVAMLVSLSYCWGLFHWQFDTHQFAFDSMLLVCVNLVGGLCCVQLESTARRSFLDTKFLSELAERDGLTGLYNRRAYNDYIERVWRQSRRDQAQVTFMMIDIDDFKAFNDLYGHQAGDDALKRVAQVIAHGAQRPFDFAARFGGEEFALVLFGPASDFGRDLPEQIRQHVEGLAIPHGQSTSANLLTVSIGVAIVTPGAERSLAGAIQLADEALYQAKEEGRNRVVIKESRIAHIQTGRFRAARQNSG